MSFCHALRRGCGGRQKILEHPDFVVVGIHGGEDQMLPIRVNRRTAPYMHDGSLQTLNDVVEFYSRGGRPNPNLDPSIHVLDLTLDEKRTLVAFLHSLDGTIREGVGQVQATKIP